MDEEHVAVNRLEHGIVEFLPLTHERATVDAFFRLLSQAMEGHPQDQTFRFIVDASKSAMPPFAYFIGKNRAWVAANPHIPPNRAAILLPSTTPFRSFIRNLLVSLMRGARNPLTISAFAPQERDKAIFWLLEE